MQLGEIIGYIEEKKDEDAENTLRKFGIEFDKQFHREKNNSVYCEYDRCRQSCAMALGLMIQGFPSREECIENARKIYSELPSQ